MADLDMVSILLGIVSGLIVFLAGVFVRWASRITAKLDEVADQRMACMSTFADAEANRKAHRRLWDALEHLRSGRRCKFPQPPEEE